MNLCPYPSAAMVDAPFYSCILPHAPRTERCGGYLALQEVWRMGLFSPEKYGLCYCHPVLTSDFAPFSLRARFHTSFEKPKKA